MQLLTALAFLSFCAVTYSQQSCRSGHCHSTEELTSLVVKLQGYLRDREYRFAKQYENCTVCFSSPCQNGGTCMPINDTTYSCECPEDTTGANCETKLTCQPDSCGTNAVCYVGNHLVNCNCKIGYAGDPYVSCTNSTKTACLNGDPHYSSFDGFTFEYQGTCPYLLSSPTPSATLGRYDNFSVWSTNWFFSGDSTSPVTAIRSVSVTFYGHEIVVSNADYQILVDGLIRSPPFYWPSSSDWQIRVTVPSSGYVIIENDQFVKVTLNGYLLCMDVPVVPEFFGADKLHGVFGNIDDNCTNDITFSNGTVASVPDTCALPYNVLTEWFGDSYIAPEFYETNPYCLQGHIVAPGGPSDCDHQQARDQCLQIYLAKSGDGVFGACQHMASNIQRYFENCEADICGNTGICSILEEFARRCQFELPGTDLGHWRLSLNLPNGTQCPEPYCDPTNSYFDTCANQCPATCADHTNHDTCSIPCMEGCACAPGFVKDNTDPLLPCIPVQQCGCNDTDGWQPANRPWLTTNCTALNVCTNGTLVSNPVQCAAEASCVNSAGRLQCQCNHGYTGDGFYCVDIDECLNPSTCGANFGHGNCTNLPGSYNCSCNPYYNGADCDIYQPRRHCADLVKYFNDSTTGIKTINPPYDTVGHPAYSDVAVYCENGPIGDGNGGWTLVSLFDGVAPVNRTMDAFEHGFGDIATRDYWMGLSLLHGMTSDDSTSLYLALEDCSSATYDCIYPSFAVGNGASQYALIINEMCNGSAFALGDGQYDPWASWLPDVIEQPPFVISNAHQGTGWWFSGHSATNLNGIRGTCQRDNGFLKYGNRGMAQARMYLRPSGYFLKSKG